MKLVCVTHKVLFWHSFVKSNLKYNPDFSEGDADPNGDAFMAAGTGAFAIELTAERD